MQNFLIIANSFVQRAGIAGPGLPPWAAFVLRGAP